MAQSFNIGGANGLKLGRLAILGGERSDARQIFALHPFQKCTARGGDIAKALGRAGLVERGHRVATSGHRNQLAHFGQGCG